MGLITPKTRIGLMGGSFNPIHLGHLLLAERALEDFSLSRVIFIPTGNPGYQVKEKPIDSEHRYQMTILATSTNPHFFVSRIEIDRKKPCYTIDTLKEMREIYPIESVELFFITGADSILEILSWKNPEEVLQLTTFIAGSRPNFSLDAFFKKVVLIENAKDKIYLMNIPMLDISSSQIRATIRSRKSIRYLVPEPVSLYIKKNELYI